MTDERSLCRGHRRADAADVASLSSAARSPKPWSEDDPVVVGVLKGSVPFLTDLTRHLPLTVEIDFLNLTRFGREGRVSIAMDLSVSDRGSVRC